MTTLNETLNPISAAERVKINQNWQMISARFSNLQYQIKLISGGADTEEIINMIQETINKAETATGNTITALQQISAALSDLQTIMDNANQLNDEVQSAINSLNTTLNSMIYTGVYSNSYTYQKGNYTRLGKDSYVALKQNVGITPSDNGVDWRLVAVGGVDGSGSVSKVDGVQPGSDGNVVLNAATKVELQTLNDLVNSNFNVTVKKSEISVNVKDYGALGNGTTDDTQAFISAIAATPLGGSLFIPLGNYILTDELTISKTITIYGTSAEDLGQTILQFNLDGKPGKAAIRIQNAIHGCVLKDFYVKKLGTETSRDGILLDGVEGDYPNFIWYTKLEGVYVNGFRNNFYFRNVTVLSVINCRAISATGNGFIQDGFATGLNYHSCYSQDSFSDGFSFTRAYYSGCFGCFSDGNLRGYYFNNTLGGYVRDCGSESCRFFAFATKDSVTYVDGITVVESGTDQTSRFRPTVVYVESGSCDVRNIIEERLIDGNIRSYTILAETGSVCKVSTTGSEKLDIRVPYDGKSSIDYQFLTEAAPIFTNCTEKDIGKIVYNKNTSIIGSGESRYIVLGYKRLTEGSGNVIGTDWLELRANV